MDISKLHTLFHDLDVTVVDDIYEYKLCDMRDKHSFFIIHASDLSGSIPAYVFYGSIECLE